MLESGSDGGGLGKTVGVARLGSNTCSSTRVGRREWLTTSGSSSLILRFRGIGEHGVADVSSFLLTVGGGGAGDARGLLPTDTCRTCCCSLRRSSFVLSFSLRCARMCALNAALCADLSPQIVHTCSDSGIASVVTTGVDIFSCFIGLTKCNTFSPAPLGVSLASRLFPGADITN